MKSRFYDSGVLFTALLMLLTIVVTAPAKSELNIRPNIKPVLSVMLIQR